VAAIDRDDATHPATVGRKREREDDSKPHAGGRQRSDSDEQVPREILESGSHAVAALQRPQWTFLRRGGADDRVTVGQSKCGVGVHHDRAGEDARDVRGEHPEDGPTCATEGAGQR
jgi:hypothetical protein